MSENDTPIGELAADGAADCAPTDPACPFRDIVAAALEAKGETLRSFSERAVDPETGKRIPHNQLPKLAKGEGYRRERWLVGAVAAATGRPLAEVQAAASEEWTGLRVGDLLQASTPETTIVVAYQSGTTLDDLPVLKERLRALGLGDIRVVSTGGSDSQS
ncbi:hypothetical protein AB0M39_12440 [Streptomyces sp. NPDC051907]|uniref:hypothetical protein n=1 Tax=Streptomyces sp. NPDC051907 TaxID=3155284 RepID=UPI0034288585